MKSVLMASTSDAFRSVVQGFLVSTGVDVALAEGPHEVKALLAIQVFDLVVVDTESVVGVGQVIEFAQGRGADLALCAGVVPGQQGEVPRDSSAIVLADCSQGALQEVFSDLLSG